MLKNYYGTGGDMNVDEVKDVIPITEKYGLGHPQEGIVVGHFNPDPAQKALQIKQLQGYELDWASNNIIESVQGDFIYDYFIDEYIDNNFTINPPLVSGY